MTRLRHSENGYIRLIEMSNTQLFAFVEGKDDRYFVGKICEVACAAYGIKYQIVIAEEIPEGTPGKQGLLNFFGMLKSQNKLSTGPWQK